MMLKTTEEPHEKVLIPNKKLNKLLRDFDKLLEGCEPDEIAPRPTGMFASRIDPYEYEFKQDSTKVIHCQNCGRIWLGAGQRMIAYNREEPEQ